MPSADSHRPRPSLSNSTKATVTKTKDNVSEEVLITRAQDAVSQCRWVVGECAALWTKRYARGRSDVDFGVMIGLTGDQVYQRRRVWETFGDVHEKYTHLKWSHFYACINWDDAVECLNWAEETTATVAEMKAWRRARRGEDLSAEAGPDPELIEAGVVQFMPTEAAWVQDPNEFSGTGLAEFDRSAANAGSAAARQGVAGVSRQTEEEYTPYRNVAGTVPPTREGSETPDIAPAPPSPEQIVRRMTSTLERCLKAITPDIVREFRHLNPELRDRLVMAASDLHDKLREIDKRN